MSETCLKHICNGVIRISFGELMLLYAKVIAEETAQQVTGKDVIKDRKKFKINMPDGSTMWITGSSISEAFLNGWKELEKSNNLEASQKETEVSNETFKSYTETWLTTYKRPRVGTKWFEAIQSILNTHIYPYIGDMQLTEIKTIDLAKLYDANNSLSLSTNTKIKNLINEILDSAIEDGIIAKNVADTKRLTVKGSKDIREPLSEDEIKTIKKNIDKLQQEDRLLISILYYTGVRRGELLALRWDNIDLENLTIKIEKSVWFNRNTPEIKDPKTKAGNRIIPICDNLKEELEKVDAEHRTGYVFGNDKPYTERKYLITWDRIIKVLDIPDATAHRFRHSFVTRMKSVLDTKTLQTISGHSQYSTTMNIYAHTTDSDLDTARRLMNNKGQTEKE